MQRQLVGLTEECVTKLGGVQGMASIIERGCISPPKRMFNSTAIRASSASIPYSGTVNNG